MTSVEYSYMDTRGMENYADHIKIVVLAALVRDGKLTEQDAEKWATSHTIIRRKKGFFRTISDVFAKTEEAETGYLLVVKKV